MPQAMQTVNYTNPSSGTAVVFYNDGIDRLTQATYMVNPAYPGTPLDLIGEIKQANELLFVILQVLQEINAKTSS